MLMTDFTSLILILKYIIPMVCQGFAFDFNGYNINVDNFRINTLCYIFQSTKVINL